MGVWLEVEVTTAEAVDALSILGTLAADLRYSSKPRSTSERPDG